jgi:putative hydroxymethylpyrimidine transport system permease protein
MVNVIKNIGRAVVTSLVLFSIWQLIVWAGQIPPYILPGPLQVLKTLILQFPIILTQLWPTVVETLTGLMVGSLLGMIAALCIANFKLLERYFFPILIISQSIPTFALAPLIVIWFGYGMFSKVITAMIMIFFPVTSSFYDGLKKTPEAYLELAKTMQAKKLPLFFAIKMPAALPELSAGLRIATVMAPIGAIIGEWVGSSEGLGYLMLNANARMQIDLMFAVLFIIVCFALSLYFCVDKLLKVLVPWQKQSIY